MKIVIIGGVAAGATCAARLSRLRPDYEIVIYEKGNYLSYASCGLPYYVGEVIKDKASLIHNDPLSMLEKYKVKAFINHEVLAILKDSKELVIWNKETGKEERTNYDKLVIATGASPIIPNWPGVNNSRILTLSTIPDADLLKGIIKVQAVKKVLVVGAGFIGLELVENLVNLGLEVTLVEKENQILANLDLEMAEILLAHLKEKGVQVLLKQEITGFRTLSSSVEANFKDTSKLETDLVILALGVKPNSSLAKNAKIALDPKGTIKVNSTFQTSAKDIYAIGDVIAIKHFISKKQVLIPLAGPANKEGRLLADILGGLNKKYQGSQGTAILKVFDLVGAVTGLNEKTLNKLGLVKGVDYETILIKQLAHASYYPGAKPLRLKVLFALKNEKILGAQVVGSKGVDKRIDVLATALRLGAKVSSLQELDLAYAPPFSLAKDPVNMLGYVAENLIRNLNDD